MRQTILPLLAATVLCVQGFRSTAYGQSTDQAVKYISMPGQTHRQPAPVETKSAENSFLINGGVLSSFPNPASARLAVTYVAAKDGDLLLRLLNRSGQQVAPEVHVTVYEGEERKFQFDVTNLADGIYVLRAEQNSATLFHRVVVAH